jgi:aspartyl protease family protein
MIRLLSIAVTAVLIMAALAALVAPRIPKSGEGDPSLLSSRASESGEEPAGFSHSGAAMFLNRDESGQFRITAAVDGADVEFLIDTGADLVALTEETAENLGVLPPPDEFKPIMQTASGVGNAARITLHSLEVGGTSFRNVDAVVVEGLSTNLLGQSVLRRFGKVELQRDRMVIRPR